MDVVSTKDIEKYGKVNYIEFRNKIIAVQDMATKRMAGLCPAYAPDPSVLTRVSGEGVS